MKEIELDFVLTVPDTETSETIMDKFLEWVVENGWTAGGGAKEIFESEMS